MPRLTVEQRFWAKVARKGPDDCWEWLGTKDSRGLYGMFWCPRRRRMVNAHRWAYDRFVAPLPAKPFGTMGSVGVVVRHICDNHGCVNPAHLLSGTQVDNSADMLARGRHPGNRGVRNPRARLTPEQVAEARAGYTGKYGELAALARRYGVSHGAMSGVLHGRTWT